MESLVSIKSNIIDILNKNTNFSNIKRNEIAKQLQVKIQDEIERKQKVSKYLNPFDGLADFKLAINDANKVYIQVVSRENGELVYTFPFDAQKSHVNFQKTDALLLNDYF